MAIHIKNASFQFTKHEKSLVLANPQELLNSEGPLLVVYMVPEARHSDLYLYAVCADSPDFIYIKVNQDVLLSYLYGNIALQEVLYSCPLNTFLYGTNQGVKSIIELPIQMLDNYRIVYSENRISDLSNGVLVGNLNQVIQFFESLRKNDPFGEEDWIEGDCKSKKISINASLFFRFEE